MKRTTLLLITSVMVFLAASGQDTLYFDKTWKKASKKDASYYRLQTTDRTGFSVRDFYLNGKLQMSGYSLSNDSLIKSGLFKYYNEDGVLTSQGNYDQNHKTGLWKTFYPGGQLHISQSYNENGKIEGGFIVYYKNSKIRRSDHYKNGDIIDGKCFTKSGNDTSWYPFQIKPEFIGGEKERIKYLKENIIYPQEAREYGIQGNVNVSFIVEIDGRIDDVELMSSSNRLLDEEALRVIRKMPHWKPGQLDGKPVKVQINLPVAFKLN